MHPTAATLPPPPAGRGGGTPTPIHLPFAGRGHKATLTPPALANRTTEKLNTHTKTPRAGEATQKKNRAHKRPAPAPNRPNRTQRTGARPATPASDALLQQVRRERARLEITLGAIRAIFEEQPSPACVRARLKQLERSLGYIADEVIKNKGAAA